MNKAEIRERLQIVQGAPKRSLGQNFLISEHVISKIIEAVVELSPESMVEVGPGLGSLTERLNLLGKPLYLIEMDRGFAGFWRERGLSVTEADALKVDWRPFPKDLLVSNLPYQISAGLVIERSMDQACFSHMVLMFQREVAQRIRSLPNKDSYGMLSVIAQTFWQIHKVVDAAPGDFFPAPKVSSRVLRFIARSSPVVDKQEYLSFVKAAFQQRRKKLIRSMATFLNNKQIGLEDFAGLCDKRGLKPTVRAQELSSEQFVELYHDYLDFKGS